MRKPVPSDDSAFKRRDAESYDQLAEDFDQLTSRYTAALADQLVAMADIAAGDRILDVGCGTGVVTLLAARKVGEGGRVVGLDLSEGMLTKAEAAGIASGLSGRIEWVRGDAEHLPFADGRFDAVLSLYALRHFPNPDQALREMYRCCAPGGSVLVAVGSAPALLSEPGLRAALRRVGELGLSLVGRAPLLAPAHLDQLIKSRVGQGEEPGHAEWTQGLGGLSQSLRSRVCKAGFSSPVVRWLGHSRTIDSIDEFWTLQFTLSSFARKRLQSTSSGQFASIREAFDAQCRTQLARGGRLVYRSGVLAVTAVRAG